MPKVWFIRHGESEADAGLPTLFPMNTQLTSNGIAQAKYIAQSFPKPPSLIITSKYIRSWQTAQPTIKRYRKARRARPDDWPIHEFTYLSPPKFAYTTKAGRQEQVKAYWERNDPYYVDGEGAESFIAFIERVSYVLKTLSYSHENFIAVFTHGQFISAVRWLLQDLPTKMDHNSMKQFRRFLDFNPISTGAILPMELDREKSAFEDMITPLLTTLADERPVNELSHFFEKIGQTICC